MNNERAASVIAFSAVLLGLAADVLLRWIPWGVNVPLFVALFLAAAVVSCRAAGRGIHWFAAVGAALAALGIVWRDSEVLVALDVILLLVFLPMLALGARGVQASSAGLTEIGMANIVTSAQAVAGFPQLLAEDLAWRKVPSGSTMRTGGVLLRGFAIALPALLLFGALLSSADAAFAKMVTGLFDFDVREIFVHLVVIAVGIAVSAGYLRSFALSGRAPGFTRPAFLSMPGAETNVALALINILFATFVIVQFRYFFGGSETLRIGNLTYSDYARRGFFELAWVVALVVPMLLIAEWLVDKQHIRTFRVLAAIQIVLVLVIAASAYRRMQLYRDAFGLTRLRFFTTAFMIWLAILLVWLAVTVLTGRRHRFAIGALATALATVVILHAVNPDAVIVRTNLARAGERPFDAAYVRSLSDDAAEELVRGGYGHIVALRNRPRGWRTWNVSRARAARLGVEGDAAQSTAAARP